MEHLIPRMGLALAIGLLVGLERGWRERNAADRSRTAGIRTYGLSGLLGGVFAALGAQARTDFVLVAGFLGFAAIFAWYKYHEATHDEDFSVTGVVAALAVFGLGALAVSGDYRAAAAGGAALAAVLASREVLHELLRRLTWLELRSALTLAAMTAIVLPLLPYRTIDPWGGLNPFEVWFFTVLSAAISFFGYVAVRVLGEARGLIVSSVAGATVSSTAVSVALGRLSLSGGNPAIYSGAACLAAMVSVLRVLLIAAVIQPSVLAFMVLPALAAALCFAAFGAFLLLHGTEGAQKPAAAGNPFDLAQLLAFAAIFAVVATASAAVASAHGGKGLLVTSSISGILDVDAAALGAMRLVGEAGIAAPLAANAILLALAANAVGRLGLAAAAGPLRFSLLLALATTAAMASGMIAFWFALA